MIHELKTRTADFEAIQDGRPFLTRPEVKGIAAGHRVRLREWRSSTALYTGHELTAEVTHVDGSSIGLIPGYVTIGLRVAG